MDLQPGRRRQRTPKDMGDRRAGTSTVQSLCTAGGREVLSRGREVRIPAKAASDSLCDLRGGT